jgi:hypothetical protein
MPQIILKMRMKSKYNCNNCVIELLFYQIMIKNMFCLAYFIYLLNKILRYQFNKS